MFRYKNFNLVNYNSYRLEATCAEAWFPENEMELLKIYQDYPNYPKIVLGNGNNVIFSKNWYKESFIVLNGCFNNIQLTGTEMVAEAGITMQELSKLAMENALSGLEIFYDIPSSLGGAVVMNAGASGHEIKDVLLKVQYLDLNEMAIKEVTTEEINFEYRNSYFQKNPRNIILKAWLKLRSGNKNRILFEMEEFKQKRWAKQPRNYPNCGSVFKRPAGHFVGPMLDGLGLKGYRIGGAAISEKHSGFIINTGNATGKDILQLIKKVKELVSDRFGIELEVEQRII